MRSWNLFFVFFLFLVSCRQSKPVQAPDPRSPTRPSDPSPEPGPTDSAVSPPEARDAVETPTVSPGPAPTTPLRRPVRGYGEPCSSSDECPADAICSHGLCQQGPM